MGIEGAVNIVFRDQLASAEDPDALRLQLERDYRESLANPYVAAARGYVDDVIDPRDTRRIVAAALAALRSKREHLPHRRHANTPL